MMMMIDVQLIGFWTFVISSLSMFTSRFYQGAQTTPIIAVCLATDPSG